VKGKLDESDEMVFRFRLTPQDGNGVPTLTEFYRQSILDLLKVVRLFSAGKPVVVDTFAFVSEPSRQIKLLAQGQPPAQGRRVCPAGPGESEPQAA
jgi:hypothetical protein